MKDPPTFFDRYQMPGFRITAADACLTQDMVMFVYYSKGKRYFSYPETVSLVNFLNNSCPMTGDYRFCIPTDTEYRQIIAKYGHRDGNCHSYHLASSLGFGFYGTIGTLITLEEYNKNPQNFNYRQAIGYGVVGNYWCEGTDEHEGQVATMHLRACGEPTFCYNILDGGANIGCSVRLIGKRW